VLSYSQVSNHGEANSLKTENSNKLFTESIRYFPGGVNSPARAWNAVSGNPVFLENGAGPYVWDADDNKYIDYVLSWGPLILGHAASSVVESITSSVLKGTSFGAPTKTENDLGKMIIDAFPSIDMIRFVSSGTEAVMSAIRLARAHTDRNKIIKFEGGYHGHADSLLVNAGSGAATHGTPSSSGVTYSNANDTLTANYNDLESVRSLFTENKNEIACVIVEPIAANMGVIPPVTGFLEGLRDITTSNSSLLIFDEVVTGFRVAYGGAQSLYNIKPDITCLGKIIGGGLPVGAYGASHKIMQEVSPLGPMYQAGTLSGNPVAMSAGSATLKALQMSGIYDDLECMSQYLEREIYNLLTKSKLPVKINRVGSMMTIFFSESEVTSWKSASGSKTDIFIKLFHSMLNQNVYLPPSPYEAMFLSTEHRENEISSTIISLKTALET